MKFFLTIICIAYILTACSPSPQETTARAAAQLAYDQAMVAAELAKKAATPTLSHDEELGSRIVKELVYIKDSKTNICYAFNGYSVYDSAFTAVPCDSLKNVKVIED